MWMINPRVMCDQHLLGEHVECHMLVGAINKGKSVQGYILGGLVEIDNVRSRHNELAAEMERRHMNHKSPLPDIEEMRFYLYKSLGEVNREQSLIQLLIRCPECRRRAGNEYDWIFK
jgi:hypothetical protein